MFSFLSRQHVWSKLVLFSYARNQRRLLDRCCARPCRLGGCLTLRSRFTWTWTGSRFPRSRAVSPCEAQAGAEAHEGEPAHEPVEWISKNEQAAAETGRARVRPSPWRGAWVREACCKATPEIDQHLCRAEHFIRAHVCAHCILCPCRAQCIFVSRTLWLGRRSLGGIL